MVLLCLRRTVAHGGDVQKLRHGSRRRSSSTSRRATAGTAAARTSTSWRSGRRTPTRTGPTTSDGDYDERLYYCQNQHADVVALVTSAGGQREMDRYSAYGVPFGLPEGDSNSDGVANATDRTIIQGWINTSHYDVRGDADLDGDVDSTDKTNIGNLGTVTLGRGALSASAVGNRRGVAGYEIDPMLPEANTMSGLGFSTRAQAIGYAGIHSVS